MGGAVSDKATAVGDAVSNAPANVKLKARGNPLAAGAVAFGLGFLVSSLIPASQKEQDAAAGLKDKAEPLKEKVSEIGKDMAANLKDSAQEAVQSVKETATDGRQNVKDEGASAKADVQGQVQESKESVPARSQDSKETVQGQVAGLQGDRAGRSQVQLLRTSATGSSQPAAAGLPRRAALGGGSLPFRSRPRAW